MTALQVLQKEGLGPYHSSRFCVGQVRRSVRLGSAHCPSLCAAGFDVSEEEIAEAFGAEGL